MKQHLPTLSCIMATLLLGLLLTACANFQPHQPNKKIAVVPENIDRDTEYAVFFVGDLGYEPSQGLQTLGLIRDRMKDVNVDQSLLLLGDLTSETGLRGKDKEEKARIDALLDVLQEVPGKIFLTPGENELGRNGYFSRLDRLEEYVDDESEKKIRFMPNNTCSGPDDEEIHEGVGLIGANSGWFLAEWNNESEVSEGCDYNDRHDFLFALADEIKGYRDKVKIVMMHHPLESNGNRGGRYSFRQHFFPLTDIIPGAYLPLPGVGSLARALQSVGGGRQDLTSLRYKDLITQIKARTEDESDVIFLGGHEHNLMYADRDYYHVVTAGSGSRRGPAIGSSNVDFAYGAIGFGRLDFLKDGKVTLRFYEVEDDGKEREVYSKVIIEDRFRPAEADQPPVIPEPTTAPTIKTPVYASVEQSRSGLYQGIFGEHYRSLFYKEVEMPVLYIDTIYGGLNPYRRGGGQTTQSLHTRGGDGRLYQLRSVRKNPVQLLPNVLERTFAADLARDQFTALHPYAPLTLPPMQKKLGLLGADPKIYFIPKQPALGEYNSNFGGEMYYLEQRAGEDWSGTEFYAGSDNIIGNDDMREEMRDDWKHRPDQRNFLRARLFDFLIGDWDRHRDQWRWAEIDQPDGFKTYLPIARDRDQVYSNFDGGLLRLAGLMVPDARKLNAFEGKLDKAKWRSLNGKWNDRFFLNEMTLEDYIAEAEFIVKTLTDEVIDEAMEAFPPEVKEYSLEQEDIDGKLKSRRAQLVEFAQDYYQVLSEVVTITATDQDDVFRAEATPDGGLRIRVFDADKKGNEDELFYDRTFNPKVTKEIRLYGMDGDDIFRLVGEKDSKIRLRLIGGTDGDVVKTEGNIGARVYDGKDGMDIEGQRSKIRDRRSDNYPEWNQYQFQEFRPDYTVPLPTFGFNVDDGLFAGIGLTVRRHGFRPDPYAMNHNFFLSGSTNGTVKFDYTGEYNATFGPRKDLVLDFDYRSPDFVVNFFGLSNETEDVGQDEGELEFNRSRQQRLLLSPIFRIRARRNRLVWQIAPFYQSYKVDRGDAREDETLISQPGVVPERVFDRQDFGGLRLRMGFNNLAVPALPDNGIKLDLHAERTYNLGNTDRGFTKYGGEFTYYQFFGDQAIGFASRIGFEHIDGEFEFYQAAQLGGRTNFRAVRSERFLGNTVFYQNIDLRIKGFGFGEKATSASFGFILGMDYGRTWLDGEESDVWHVAYGGGPWLNLFNAAVFSATYFTSSDGSRINIGGGFPF